MTNSQANSDHSRTLWANSDHRRGLWKANVRPLAGITVVIASLAYIGTNFGSNSNGFTLMHMLSVMSNKLIPGNQIIDKPMVSSGTPIQSTAHYQTTNPTPTAAPSLHHRRAKTALPQAANSNIMPPPGVVQQQYNRQAANLPRVDAVTPFR